MAGNQIQQNMDSLFMCLVKKPDQVFIRPVSGRRFLVITDIITRVLERRVKARIDPERVKTELPDIIQPGNDPLEISDPI